MKKLIRITAAVLTGLMLLSASACDEKKDEEYPVKMAGIEITQKPKRVLCLSDSIADILIASGYTDLIAARTDECDQEELVSVSSVGSMNNPSFARIKAADPEIIFTDKTVDEDIVRKLENSDYKVFNMIHAENGKELSVLYSSIGAIIEGDKTGRQNGSKKASSLLQSLDAMERAIPDPEDDGEKTAKKKTACYLYDVNGKCITNNSFSAKFFDYAKLDNACDNSETTLGAVETIRLSDPDYIFCDVGVKVQIEKSEKFAELTAVKKGHIYEIKSSDMYRQGDTMTDVLSFMIQSSYPELRADGNAEEYEEESEVSKEESSQKETSDKNEETSKKEESSKKSENSKSESSQTLNKPPFEITEETAFGSGQQDAKIKKIQQRLKELGYSKFKDGITGFYGEETHKAVTNFQKKNGLEADGMAGAQTLKLLFSDEAKSA